LVSSDLLWLLASIDLVFDADHSRILRSGALDDDIELPFPRTQVNRA
jgi:hypothetical protein